MERIGPVKIPFQKNLFFGRKKRFWLFWKTWARQFLTPFGFNYPWMNWCGIYFPMWIFLGAIQQVYIKEGLELGERLF